MNSEQRVSLGTALRAAREAQGLSYGQLAILVGVNKSQVLRWETGDRPPSPQNLVDLARQLELRAADLFDLAGIPIPADLLSLPAMLRAEYDLPKAAITRIQRYIETTAAEYRPIDSSKHSTRATRKA